MDNQSKAKKDKKLPDDQYTCLNGTVLQIKPIKMQMVRSMAVQMTTIEILENPEIIAELPIAEQANALQAWYKIMNYVLGHGVDIEIPHDKIEELVHLGAPRDAETVMRAYYLSAYILEDEYEASDLVGTIQGYSTIMENRSFNKRKSREAREAARNSGQKQPQQTRSKKKRRR